ncbi:MAG: universal stress protein [Desulfomonile tiedjei]|nr:universal stress protein [Desulfomonile tiedjei]
MLPKNILFCTDFSENSQLAQQYAMDFSAALTSQLTIIHVIDSSLLGYSSLGERIPAEVRNLLEEIHESVGKALDIIAADCAQHAPEVFVSSRMGKPGPEILRASKELSSDLIVMGTHGRTGLQHLLLGSTAARVLREADCPVLIVRSSPQPAAGE